MILMDTVKLQTFNNRKLDYYKNLGYDINNDTIDIKIEHLTTGSRQIVRVECDFCNNIECHVDKYKIFSTSSYGANPYSLGRLCSSSLVNWIFDSETEMNNFFEYINTKIFRFCVSLIKNKQDISKNTFSLIPKIDFSKCDDF
jgi:hypothetical protein